MADKAQNSASAWTPVDESTNGWTAVDETPPAPPQPFNQQVQQAFDLAVTPTLHSANKGFWGNAETAAGNVGRGALSLASPFVHPLKFAEDTARSLPPVAAYQDIAHAFGRGPGSVYQEGAEGFGAHPIESTEELAGQLLGGKAMAKLPAAASGIREAALGDPDEAAMRGLHISPQSPKALRTLSAVGGSRPFLQGVKGLEDLQNRVPMAKQEIWAPMEDTLNQVGGKQVTGPNGPTTLRDLENRRLEISAQLRALKSGGPEAMALAQQKGLTQAGLLQEEASIKSALDPHLRSAGIDPEAIRKSFGQVSSIGGRVAGKTTLGEAPIPTGFGRMTDIKLDNPRSWVGEPVRGVRDIFAGRPLWSANPTDMNIREAFRAGGPKPDFTVPTQPPPTIAGLLPEGLKGLPEGRQVSRSPFIEPTTRAQRLGLLLPEKAGGKITLPYNPEMTGGEKTAAFMHELRRTPQKALPRRASPFITPPPQ